MVRRACVQGDHHPVTEQDAVLQQNCATGKEGGAVKLINDFKTFLFRGNVVDLAVAVVIGTAFTAVVKALVSDILTPVIAAIFGSPNFGDRKFTINGSQFAYGDFLNNLLAFVLIAAAIFFLVVTPINWLMSRRAEEDPD